MKNKGSYEQYLNEISPEYESPEWVIGGKVRTVLMQSRKYGTALRKYDPIAFIVGYNNWLKER